MSRVRVPVYPPVIDSSAAANQIRNAAPVRGPGQWSDHGSLTAWLLGRGSTLVSAAGMPVGFIEPNFIGISDGDSKNFYYYTWPHRQNPTRIWYITLARWPANTRCFGTFTTDSGATGEWEIPASAGSIEPIVFELYEHLASPSSSPTGVSLNVAHAAASHDTAQVWVTAVSMHELPAVNLDDFGGVTVPDLDSLEPGRLIYENVDGNKSLHAVSKAAALCEAQARRACFGSFCNPDGVSITNGSFEAITSQILTIPRKRYNGVDETTIAWAAFVVSVSGVSELLVQAASGDSDTETVAAGIFPDWVTGTLDVQCQDMSRLDIDGGIPNAGVADTVSLQGRITTASSLLWVSFCWGEPD